MSKLSERANGCAGVLRLCIRRQKYEDYLNSEDDSLNFSLISENESKNPDKSRSMKDLSHPILHSPIIQISANRS